ncbi:hypothetical protein KIF59_09120 [Enterobacter cloacae subsp. cloacae]|nr:hypothetical protein [Enterobacter cloacae subsp. cloacae]
MLWPIPPGYHFVRAENRIADIPNEHFELALVNEITQEIVYYNRVIYQKDAFLNYIPVTQILMALIQTVAPWRVARSAGKVFSPVFAGKYNVIITDRHQTRDGMSFTGNHVCMMLSPAAAIIYAYDAITLK